MTSLSVRPGGRADVDAVLGLLDRATEWLVALGRTDQWGTGLHSSNPRWHDMHLHARLNRRRLNRRR